VLPVIEALRRDIALPLSIDTSKSAVAEAAIAAVPSLSTMSAADLRRANGRRSCRLGCGAVRHAYPRPTGDHASRYLLCGPGGRGLRALQGSVARAVAAGVVAERIAVDPGDRLRKDVAGNLELLRRLPAFAVLGRPLLLGTSRKSFIGRVLGLDDPAARQAGTLATVALGVASGCGCFASMKSARRGRRRWWRGPSAAARSGTPDRHIGNADA